MNVSDTVKRLGMKAVYSYLDRIPPRIFLKYWTGCSNMIREKELQVLLPQ